MPNPRSEPPPLSPPSPPSLLADRLPALRRAYDVGALDDDHLAPDPFDVFHAWFGEAEAAGEREPNAMTLATVDLDGSPDARSVLLKGLDDRGFVFFTNYASPKGHHLAAEPRAALLFRWGLLERQVRVRGVVAKVSAAESDEYFATRPEGSRFGAAASPQSQVIADRSVLERAVEALRQRYPDGKVPRPEHWGGYRLFPEEFEFWQGRVDRLHDRFRYTRDATGWHHVRLAP